MTKEGKKEHAEFTRKDLQDILAGVKKLSDEDLAKVFGGACGDDREEYTLDEAEIEKDIFGTKF